MSFSARWSADEWTQRRANAVFGRLTRVESSCASTQDVAMRWAQEQAPQGALVLAHEQTRGRGRRGRTWLANEGGLYFSLLLRPQLAPDKLPRIPLLCAAALLGGLRELEVDAHIKWPNDVLCPADTPGPLGPFRKVAGILAEPWLHQNRIEAIVVGVGINVVTPPTGFSPEIADRAAALWNDGHGLSPDRLLLHLLPHLEEWLSDVSSDHLFSCGLDALRRHSATLGREVCAPEEGISGVAEDIEPDGALRVRSSAGETHRILAGDVLPAQISP